MNVQSPSDSESNFKKPFHFKCVQCGKCCSDPNTLVNLTYSDILRMHWDLNYDIAKLMEAIGFYVFEEKLTEEQKDQMVIPPIQTEKGLAYVALRKKENGRCLFLNNNNKCMIYAARPDICRTFPFHFHATPYKEPKKKLDIELTLATKAREYCVGFDLKNKKINPEYWLGLGKIAIEDILKENILVNKWNAAIDDGKISPIAKNYIGIILNQIADDSKSSPNSKTASHQNKDLSLKERARQKIKNQKK